MTDDRIDELLELVELHPEGMREAEFLQIQQKLDALVGKTIASAGIEETRVVVTTDDGNRYYFYGFLGSRSSTD